MDTRTFEEAEAERQRQGMFSNDEGDDSLRRNVRITVDMSALEVLQLIITKVPQVHAGGKIEKLGINSDGSLRFVILCPGGRTVPNLVSLESIPAPIPTKVNQKTKDRYEIVEEGPWPKEK